MKPETLYTSADIKRVREEIFNNQNAKCALTGIDITNKDAVLDHDHKNNYVRAVLHRQSNAVLGKIENLYTRYLSWWYNGSLSDFLRQVADYLDVNHPKLHVHPGWMKKVKTTFNKLKAADKDKVLILLGSDSQVNETKRKETFSKILLKRHHDYDTIVNILNSIKDNNKE
jgi:hypothetical protein